MLEAPAGDDREKRTWTRTGYDPVDVIAERIHERFWTKEQIMSFSEYLSSVEEAPWLHVRSSAQYLKDCFDYFGDYETQGLGGPVRRFRLFDKEWMNGEGRIHGSEEVQNQLYGHLSSFAERGRTDKILVLHGPNGTGKTSFVQAMMDALQYYSHQPEGVLYTFNWVFSDKADKVALGFNEKHALGPKESLAKIEADDISFKLRCDLRDSPLLLIPPAERRAFLKKAFARHDRPFRLSRVMAEGDLCHKYREIYNELLSSYHGDWTRVVQHVQVARFHVSKRYRRCAVTIEPQRNVDASARPLNLERSFQLPTILQQANVHETFGDLIDGNRGVVEYSDFFKRPMEMNKYLLTTSEQGTISMTSTMAYLDVVLMATSNEKHLTLFKADPDFSSFKARMELIKVPYLLQWRRESRLYEEKLPSMARGKHIGPHVSSVMGLWAVLTRLRKPQPQNYKGALAEVVARLGAVDKARLYDSGEAPSDWRDQDRRELLAGRSQIAAEFEDSEDKFEGIYGPEYEGRRGVSAREMLTLINEAALSRDHGCLSPLAVFGAMKEFVKDRSLYDFLRLDAQKTFGDIDRLTEMVEDEYRRWVTDEVRDSTALISEDEYERLFADYFIHVKAWKNKEKVNNSNTGKVEDPSEDLMSEVEGVLEIQESADDFRSNLIMRIAGWAIENPGKTIDYRGLFEDIFSALKRATYERRSAAVSAIQKNILKYGTDEWPHLLPAEQHLVERTLERMQRGYGYCEACAKEVLSYMLARET